MGIPDSEIEIEILLRKALKAVERITGDRLGVKNYKSKVSPKVKAEMRKTFIEAFQKVRNRTPEEQAKVDEFNKLPEEDRQRIIVDEVIQKMKRE